MICANHLETVKSGKWKVESSKKKLKNIKGKRKNNQKLLSS